MAQAIELRERISSDQKCREWDLVDFTDFMLATGLRIGEAGAVTWPALKLDVATVEVRGTVVRIKDKGLQPKARTKARTKSKSGYRTLELPAWAVEMLRRRRAEASPNEWDVVFTAPLGGLRDPSNTQSDLRKVFDRAGYEWGHVARLPQDGGHPDG